MTTVSHPRALVLRQLLAQEPVADAVRAHASACAECQQRLEAFRAEQGAFEAEIPFERFAAGVERASRVPAAPARPRWPLAAGVGLALAASLLVVLRPTTTPETRLKGGAQVELVVASAGRGQRPASRDPAVAEPLSAGDRVRIGVESGAWRYVVAVSVDEAGQITPLYPEHGAALSLERRAGTEYLPESLEFTGQGLERVIVVLADTPLPVEAVSAAAHDAFVASGNQLKHFGNLRLTVPAEQFQRTVLKP
jgi:hypothetical protein